MKGKFFEKIIFLGSTLFVLLFSSLITFGGPEKCSPSNYKFTKKYDKISHSLLPNDIWRNEKEKNLFFGCVQAEEKFVKEVIGENESIPFKTNMSAQFSPEGTGKIMPGNRRNLRIYPIEIEVVPGEEYIAVVQYLEGMSYISMIPYYSSDAIEWDYTNNGPFFAGAWDFHVQANGTVYYPRFWDSIRFKVKKNYSNGRPVKKAIVRFMLSLAYMEENKSSLFAVIRSSEAAVSIFRTTPRRDATIITRDGKFY